MRRARSGIRCNLFAAILATIWICVPGANARQQTATAAEVTQSTSTAQKKSAGAKTSSSHSAKSASSRKTAPPSPSTKATATHRSTRRSARKSKSSRVRGQQKIDSGRATSIQEALIREHYLNGEPSGVWDAESEAAMRRYQSDHGWQSKEVPDSRALIKLGLGPSNDHLLNPDSAMTSTPIAHRSAPPAAASASPAPAQTGANPGGPPTSAKPAPDAPPATPQKNSDDSAGPQ